MRTFITIAVTVVVTLGIAGGIGVHLSRKARRKSAPPTVWVQPPSGQDLVEIVSAPATVAPRAKVAISARVSARVRELPFRCGQVVTKGDPSAKRRLLLGRKWLNIFHLRSDNVVRGNLGNVIEPESGKARQDYPLVRDAVGHDHIKGTDAVGGHDEEIGPEVVDVAHLSPAQGEPGEVCAKKRFAQKIPRLQKRWGDGATVCILVRRSKQSRKKS